MLKIWRTKYDRVLLLEDSDGTAVGHGKDVAEDYTLVYVTTITGNEAVTRRLPSDQFPDHARRYSFEPEYVAESTLPRKRAKIAEVATEAAAKLYDAVASLTDKMTNVDHGGHRKVGHRDKIACCLPVHHGIYIPEVDAVIDKPLAAVVQHIASKHPDVIELTNSCAGGSRDHIVSYSVDSTIGYLSFRGPIDYLARLGEENVVLTAENVVIGYPTWLDVAATVEPDGSIVAAWKNDPGREAAVAALLETAGCDEACRQSIESASAAVTDFACDFCGDTAYDGVQSLSI